MMRQWRLFAEWLLIGLSASLVVAIAASNAVLERADWLVYDLASPFYAPPTDDRILIAAIDDEALARLGRWPWPRAVHADAIAAIDSGNPAAIVYDVLFIEPSPDDAALADTLRAAGSVYLPLLLDMPGPNGAPYFIQNPIAPIGDAAAGAGTVNLTLDSDGQTRSIAIAPLAGGTPLPHVAELAYRQLAGHPSPALMRTRDTGEPLHIAFRPTGSFRTISLSHLISGEVPHAFLRGKLVIVGATAQGMGDLHPVSAARGGLMAGVEIQANLLSSMLADRFIAPLSSHWLLPLSLAPLWLLLIAFWWLTPSRSLLLSIGAIAAVILAAALLLALRGWWFPPTAALLGIALVYPLWGWRRLAAVTQYMENEVAALLTETGIGEPDGSTHAWSGDHVAGNTSRLHRVITLMRSHAEEREQVLQFLSHDMRTPQAAIIALVDSQIGNEAATGPLPQNSVLARVRRNAERTLQLADNFVQLARLGSQEILSEPVDLADAMAQAADIVWSRARAKQQQIIRKDFESGELWVEGDAAALVRAFANLLANAVQAAPEGGTIHCGVERQGRAALACVTDNGPGLPPERRADPFARFGYSSHNGANGEQGSGLGLAYVQAVAQRHHGSVHYADAEGGGARFTMRLPLADEAESAKPVEFRP